MPAVVPGVPAGIPEAILTLLRRSPTPLRRRAILDALEQGGHRISLAGLNRALQHLREAGETRESADGVAPLRR